MLTLPRALARRWTLPMPKSRRRALRRFSPASRAPTKPPSFSQSRHRSGIPDLLDRSAGKSVRDTVDRVLAGSAGDFQRLDRVRSRRSGRVVFVEIVLSFEPGLTIAEVNRRIAALEQSMANEIEHADISILIQAPQSLEPAASCRQAERQ